jgi:hypothetical protein
MFFKENISTLIFLFTFYFFCFFIFVLDLHPFDSHSSFHCKCNREALLLLTVAFHLTVASPFSSLLSLGCPPPPPSLGVGCQSTTTTLVKIKGRF